VGLVHKLQSLFGERSGTAAVELAVMLPFLAMLLAGGYEYTRAFIQMSRFEQAAQRASELALMRPPTANTTAQLAHIKTEAANASGQVESNIIVELYRDCNDNRQTNYTTACGTGQVNEEYVRVQVSGTYPRTLDWRRFAGQTTGATPTLTAEANVRVR
jgi:Flp pilus assembly protein TadG